VKTYKLSELPEFKGKALALESQRLGLQSLPLGEMDATLLMLIGLMQVVEGLQTEVRDLQAQHLAAAAAAHRDRRERIATEAMKAFLSGPRADGSTYEQVSHHAVYCADALIAELDKPKEVKP